jgi:hypothetical protein
MWNRVALVAQHQKVDPAALVDFALSNERKYGIDIVGGEAMVSNWHSEDLVADFKQFEIDLFDTDAAFVDSMEHMYPHIAGIDIGCEFDGQKG